MGKLLARGEMDVGAAVGDMPRIRLPWLPWLVFGSSCVLTVLGLVFLVLSWSAPVPDTFAFRGHAGLLALAFGSVGQFLARRRPQNIIGWLFLAAGLAASVQEFGQEYAAYAVFLRSDVSIFTRLVAWIASWITVIALGTIMSVLLLFPDGRLPSPRWRPFARVQIGLWVITTVNSITKPGPLRFAPFLDNPYPGSAKVWQIVMMTTGVAIGISLLVMAASILVRLSRAEGIERQQLKWFTFTGTLVCIVGLVYTTAYRSLALTEPGWIKPIDILAIVIPLAMPLAVGLAIFRYRLWEIDVLINRTLVYGTLSAGIIITYSLIVGVLGALLNTHANLAAAIATVAVTALSFAPARARLQRAVTRVHQAGGQVPCPIQEADDPYAGAAIALTRALPWLLFGLTCALAALDFIFLSLDGGVPLPTPSRWTAAVYALACSGVGQLLARKRPKNAIGWLFLLAGLVSATAESAYEYAAYAVLLHPGALPGGTLAAWIASWIWVSIICISVYIFLLFPTGHLPSARWRPVAWALVGAAGLMTFAQMFGSGPLRMAPYLDNPFAIPGSAPGLGPIGVAAYSAAILCQLAAVGSVIVRLRRARGVERQQLKWFAYAAVLVGVVGFVQSAPGAFHLAVPNWWGIINLLMAAVIVALPFSVGLAILRYRLYDIDRVINHTLVYGALTAGIVALYVLLVGALSALSQTTGNLLISLLATGLIAVLFQPLREQLQRGVNRLLYGERDEPYAFMARLGQNLETTPGTETILVTLVRTIAQALKLPFVAIETETGDAVQLAAAYGQASKQAQSIPLTYQGEKLGDLLVAPRGSNEPLSPADLNLLRMIAQQAGMAVHAVRLSEDLQRSRERLIVTREEERRRIRRDLHDGLGPALASLAMEADNAREWIQTDPNKTGAALADITTRAQAALADIRRLVYDLRPPALDELGLVGALRQTVVNAPNGLRAEIEAQEPLPVLSAAVEVAAYRIAQETLNNVFRHSHAHNCLVRITIQDDLQLEITDDGLGLPADVRAGVGMISMRERAAELGGSCVIESAQGGGTQVSARLPLAPHDSENG